METIVCASVGQELHLTPVSPPAYSSVDGCCSRFAESEKKLYRIAWRGESFAPYISDEDLVSVEVMSQSPAYSLIMATTTLLSYGSECQIRISDSPQRYPIHKLAMPSDHDGRNTVEHEHQLLRTLQSHDLTVEADESPLRDDHGVFGYSMQRLEAMTIHEIMQRFHEVEEMVQQLHELDVIHGDLTTSNIMKTPSAKLRMIDFGQSGFINQPLPTRNLWRRYRGHLVFSTKIDMARLDEMQRRLTAEIMRDDARMK